MSKKQVLWWAMFVAYCGVIAWITLLDRKVIEREYETKLFLGLRMWLSGEPNGEFVLRQYFQNIIFFIPFGFILGKILEGKRKKIVLIGFLSSAIIELSQYLSARGLAEIDDVISNTIGTVIGCFLWLGVHKFLKKGKQ